MALQVCFGLVLGGGRQGRREGGQGGAAGSLPARCAVLAWQGPTALFLTPRGRSAHKAVCTQSRRATHICTGVHQVGHGCALLCVGARTRVQVLRQLAAKGPLLLAHPAYAAHARRLAQALGTLRLPVALPPALRAARALAAQLRRAGATRADRLPPGLALLQQRYRQPLADACEQLLAGFLAVGALAALCAAAAPTAALPGAAAAAAPAVAAAAGGNAGEQLFWAWAAEGGVGSTLELLGGAAREVMDLSGRPGGAGLAGAAYAAMAATGKWHAEADGGTGTVVVDGLLALMLGGGGGAGREAAAAAALRAARGPAAAGVGEEGAAEEGVRRQLAGAAYVAVLYAPGAAVEGLSGAAAAAAGGDKAAADELPEYEQVGARRVAGSGASLSSLHARTRARGALQGVARAPRESRSRLFACLVSTLDPSCRAATWAPTSTRRAGCTASWRRPLARRRARCPRPRCCAPGPRCSATCSPPPPPPLARRWCARRWARCRTWCPTSSTTC